MIHLKDIKQGEDFANYPWQRLVDAVKRACNVTVAPPLEMHQSYAGTVISLNAGAVGQMLTQYPNLPAVPCYAVRNNAGSGQSVTAGTTVTVVLDTQIHRYPNDTTAFTLSSSIITAVGAGVYSVDWELHAVSSELTQVSLFLDKNSGTEVTATRESPQIGTTPYKFSGHCDIVLAANDTIRLRFTESGGGSAMVSIYDGGSSLYGALYVRKFRDS